MFGVLDGLDVPSVIAPGAGMGEGAPAPSPSMAGAAAASVEGVADKLLGKLSGWLEGLVVMVPNLLLAVLVVVLANLVSRWAQSATRRVLLRISRNQPVSELLGSVARIAVIVGGVLWALELMSLDKTVTSLLAGVGVVGLALGFAFQDIAANFMSGFILALYRPFDVGDQVEIAGRQCRVERIELRATMVQTLDGLSIIVPNKDVFQNPIVNYTRTKHRRLDLVIGTAYGDDLEHVRRVIHEAVQEVPGRDRELPVEVFKYLGLRVGLRGAHPAG